MRETPNFQNSSNNFVAMTFPSLPKKLLTRSFSTPGWDVGERPSRSMPYFKLPEHEGLEVWTRTEGTYESEALGEPTVLHTRAWRNDGDQ